MKRGLHTEVLVVGAGPAGGAAALQLAATGRQVLLVERSLFPREKVCGDGLLEDSMKTLGEMGLAEAVRKKAHHISKIRFIAPSGKQCDLEGEFYTLRRQELDALIVEEACRKGAEFVSGLEVTAPLEQDSRVTGALAVDQQGQLVTIRARVVLLAPGTNARVLHSFGLLQERRPNAVGIRAYYRLQESLDDTVMYISYDRRMLPAYCWMFPMGNGVYNVGRGVFLSYQRQQRSLDPRRPLFVSHAESLTAVLQSARRLGPIRAAPLRTGFRGARACRQGVLVLGEALGLTFPLIGEGIGNALESGLTAARVVARALESREVSLEALREYERRLRQRQEPFHRAYLQAEAWFRHTLVANCLIARTARSAELKTVASKIISRQETARAIFSLRGLSKVLLAR
ncbi:MAG: geranylgeranyl reductase family protein [Deltaproteobacteria bacterium]|nr:geranylgeranyl reductase family protein [Deltaproteobacteria bacterium]